MGFHKFFSYIVTIILWARKAPPYMGRCLDTLTLKVSIGHKLLSGVLGLWIIQVPWINYCILISYTAGITFQHLKETFVSFQIFVTINTDFSPPITITSSFIQKQRLKDFKTNDFLGCIWNVTIYDICC